MSIAAIIPARLASSRLPEKALLKETGKYLIQHVYEQVCRVRQIQDVFIATDHERILQAAESFGAKAFLTSPNHLSGTDRIAEVAARLNHGLILNVQGDEPEIDPAAIEHLAQMMLSNPDVEMGTLAVPIQDWDVFQRPNVVKVVVDNRGDALYFSRSSIPYCGTGGKPLSENTVAPLHHLGIYAFQRQFLLKFVSLPPGRLERLERLEQLRALEHGHRIRVGLWRKAFPGIDTPEEYRAFVERWKRSGQVQ